MEETHQVYIIQSEQHGRFYTGISSDPDKRLHFHNLGLNKSTRSGSLWLRVWHSEQMPKRDALALEKKIKKRGAARFLEDMPVQ